MVTLRLTLSAALLLLCSGQTLAFTILVSTKKTKEEAGTLGA